MTKDVFTLGLCSVCGRWKSLCNKKCHDCYAKEQKTTDVPDFIRDMMNGKVHG